MIELAYCPNNECLSESCSQEETDEGYHYIFCHGCSMEGPVAVDDDDAAMVWNALPREAYEDDGEEEEDSPTIATLVRMLDEERQSSNQAKSDYIELEGIHHDLMKRYDERKKQQLAQAYGMDESPGLKLRIEGLEQTIKQLDDKLRLKTEHHENQKGAWKKAHAEIMQLRIKASDAETELSKVRCNYDDVLYVIDKALAQMKFDRCQENHHVTVDTILTKMRDDEWRNNDPAAKSAPNSALDEILYRSSPYHSEHNQEIYDFAITCLGQRPEVFPMELYGMVMEKYVQSSRMHQLAWNAAGRPGETKHNVRRPRT